MRTRLVAGVIGGAAGLLAMEVVRRVTSPLVEKWAHASPAHPPHRRSMSAIGTHHYPDESATDALGRIAYEKITGHGPTAKAKRAASWAVHIGYGLKLGAIYGLLRAETCHPARDGLAFAFASWLLVDELASSLFGLADKPTAYPIASHVQSLAQHVGYGLALASTTRVANERLFGA
jgi:hypothetical protein